MTLVPHPSDEVDRILRPPVDNGSPHVWFEGDVVCLRGVVGVRIYYSRMAGRVNYSDEELTNAVVTSKSWRGVLRALGMASSSSRTINNARNRADELGLNYIHFSGSRQRSRASVGNAIQESSTWAEVIERLGRSEPNAMAIVKGHAARLGIDYSHLSAPMSEAPRHAGMVPDICRIGRAGPMLAAAWFTLCGRDVSWPLEPCRYDLLIDVGTGTRRVQVKTTTVRVGTTWKVYLSTSGSVRRTYDPDEIDDFFVIAGDMTYFLIPVEVVGGLQAIHLSAYEGFRLTRDCECVG